MTKKQQRGGSAVGFILGIVVGLGVALAVAVYVTKVPVPFLNKGGARGSDQDALESQRNKNWDPNSPLYGKNPARPATPAASTPAVAGVVPAPASTPASAAVAAASTPRAGASKPAAGASSADPLGDLARARAAAGAEPFDYFVQAGAFRTQADADAQRAKLAMLGWEARVSEREQNGRTVFRVRVGPFTKRDDAEMLKEKLDGAGVESALVRVQH
ncbi:SPOR domain-containing protein [Paracidovorax citrulli]|nr:SPOR domain-containing protein [Paracidovorax citrulli]ATG95819.1 SPOR domain-containing protein [Paracidovorax citrulli]PVY65202.1 cell division protein FtsN [Paracidovorax citrulli]REG70608.1 cell division protein FtsN [Paracidovorax citrulli]RLJ95160.1 cell division protein FtsN [Paracidovorax citrulli]UMT85237.1 SPOR domain-containing protein [Paracidovorax citrulli]